MRIWSLRSTLQSIQNLFRKAVLASLLVVAVLVVSSILTSSTSCNDNYKDCVDIAADTFGSCTRTNSDEIKRKTENCLAFYNTEIGKGADKTVAQQELTRCVSESKDKGQQNLDNCSSEFDTSIQECARRLKACVGM